MAGTFRAEHFDHDSDWLRAIQERVGCGARYAGSYATQMDSGTAVVALLVRGTLVEAVSCTARVGSDGLLHTPSLVPAAPAALWYERSAHDLSGVVADGHPRLVSLLLPIADGTPRPLPGGLPAQTERTRPESRGTAEVSGQVFSLPWGPVRSGVQESLELLLETPGEDIPHLSIRPHYKHRGIAKQFEGRTTADGVLVAERVEGIASVAHALAFSHAVEAIAGVRPPTRARIVRVLLAELERLANHLDATMKVADTAGLAVATARFGARKETVLRVESQLTGSRFSRGVVVPGGVRPGVVTPDARLGGRVAHLHAAIRSDIAALESSPSFLDRLRTTGILSPARARRFGALGPIGKGSGFDDDCRRERPTDAYSELGVPIPVTTLDEGDALARMRVRWREIDTSIELVTAALNALADVGDSAFAVPVPEATGMTVGWSEAPQGEILYALHLDNGVVQRCLARSPALHDLVLLHDVIRTDIFTDLPFIEASFGLSYAGVAM